MEFELELLEVSELEEELAYQEWELSRNIREAYEDMLHTQYDEIDRLYW